MPQNLFRRRLLALVAAASLTIFSFQGAFAGCESVLARRSGAQHRVELNSPDAVTSLSALVQREQVLIKWDVSRDFEAASYRCLRSRAPDEEGEVIYVVAAQGGIGIAHYEYVDRPPVAGEYFYWIEEVEIFGMEWLNGPARAFVGQSWVSMPLVRR